MITYLLFKIFGFLLATFFSLFLGKTTIIDWKITMKRPVLALIFFIIGMKILFL